MKKLSIICLLLSTMAIASCSSGNKPTPEQKDKYTIHLSVSSAGEPIELEYEFSYSLKDFEKDSTVFNRSIALLSLAQVVNCSNMQNIGNVYNKLGFKDIVYNEDYTKPEDKDSIKFTIARYETEEYNLVSVSTNGLNYSKQWINNLTLGAEGDATGFIVATNKVITGIKIYLNSYTDKPFKLWISGYSRSAAISAMAGYRLIDDGTVQEKDLFVYEYECPKVIDASVTKEYKSIFNILSSADLITHIAPTNYNFKRVGVDVDIYKKKIDSWLKQIDSSWKLNSFTPTEKYSTESELLEYFFNTVLCKEIEYEDFHDLSTRANYAEYYEDSITYLVGMMFSLKSSTMNQIQTKISQMSMMDMVGLLATDGAYNFLKPILDANNESYDDAKLRSSTNLFVSYIQKNSDLLALLMDGNARNSIVRCTTLHYPEYALVLLEHY